MGNRVKILGFKGGLGITVLLKKFKDVKHRTTRKKKNKGMMERGN